jgi:hypothetical protein
MAPQRASQTDWKEDIMIELEYNGFTGTTCGQRKDGSRAVLWSDNQVEWFSADEFENIIHLSMPSILADTEV